MVLKIQTQVTIVGQGYVGLPLAIAAAQSGYKVFGFDNDDARIQSLKSGKSPIEDVSDKDLKNQIDKNNYEPTTDTSSISKSEVVLICVPTPLTKDRKPDLEVLISATTTVANHIRPGTLVVIESTIAPGTCRNTLLPLVLRESNLKLVDFDLAYSPERIDPTNSQWGIKNTPKLISGLTEEACIRSHIFYSKFIDTIFKCSSLEVAESAKLLENAFRFINISFINELSTYFFEIGVNANEVIAAASTKPYGFMQFFPGVGVGGHCIPVDSLYLSTAAKSIGVPLGFIELASKINDQMPEYFISKAEKILGGLKGRNILVVGIAYKPNVSDVRESPAVVLIEGLRSKGAIVSWHDNLVKTWNAENSVPLNSGYDLAVIATSHSNVDLTKLGFVTILDSRNPIP